jgi:hypothetical protein
MAALKTQYRPNLSHIINVCEVNYMMLLRLIGDRENVGEQRCFFISDFLSYTILITEVTRYTSLITMTQDSQIDGYDLSHLMRPKMVIRLYHDARLAEVISNQGIRQVKPRYDYPNKQMHQPDEKQQINIFLKEWLQLSLQLGRSTIPFAV